jgi:hypothetical protein
MKKTLTPYPFSIFDKISKDDLREILEILREEVDFDIESIFEETVNDIAFIAGKEDKRKLVKDLESRWYSSLESGEPDSEVYYSIDYLPNLWSCWAIYLRNYLRSLKSPKGIPADLFNESRSVLKEIGSVKKVVDLGNGIGYSTALIKELFPGAHVFATNFEGSPQFKIGEAIAETYRFTLLPEEESKKIGKAEVVFALDYFEHFKVPIDELDEVIETFSPDYLITANAFGTRSIGHFETYRYGSEILTGSKISRKFNDRLRSLGYEKLETRIWNDRPSVWKRKPVTLKPL